MRSREEGVCLLVNQFVARPCGVLLDALQTESGEQESETIESTSKPSDAVKGIPICLGARGGGEES